MNDLSAPRWLAAALLLAAVPVLANDRDKTPYGEDAAAFWNSAVRWPQKFRPKNSAGPPKPEDICRTPIIPTSSPDGGDQGARLYRETAMAMVDTRATTTRRNLKDLTPGERERLVSAILPYLSDEIVSEHAGMSHDGRQLFVSHDRYVIDLETYLIAHDAAEFVPLPYWDPADDIPAEFRVVKPHDDGRPREAIEVHSLKRYLPDEFRFPRVCRFKTDDELALAVNSWHGEVHVAIGGAMGRLSSASAAPIFWSWHAFVSQIREHWKACAGVEPAPRRLETF